MAKIKKEKCCHDINRKNTSILLLNKFQMTCPGIVHGVCKICGKPFDFEEEKIRKEEVFDVDGGRNEKEA